MDKRGFWIGPRQLGYRAYHFTAGDDERFSAIIVGEPEKRLRTRDFVALTEDPYLIDRYEKKWTRADTKEKVGVAMLGVGSGFVATALAFIVAGTIQQDGNLPASAPPFMAAGIPHLSVGMSLAMSGLRGKAKINRRRLEVVFDRSEAWEGVQRYNSRLREAHGLPDDELLDSPPRREKSDRRR